MRTLITCVNIAMLRFKISISKGNKFAFRGGNSFKFVLPTFCKGVYSKNKIIFLPGGAIFFLFV